MPLLVRFMTTQFANGAVLGLALVEALLFTDAFQLASLVATSGKEGAMTLLLFGQAALYFGTAQMSVAVMNLR
jgi:hypothetical protein